MSRAVLVIEWCDSCALQWLEGLQQRARALVGGGATVEQARLQLLGSRDFLYYFSMGDFSQMHLLRGLLGVGEDEARAAR
jgi:hypothetical protein